MSGKYLAALFILTVSSLNGQSSDTLRLKNQELSRIKKDIAALQNELQSKTKKERESLKSLENINQQNLLLNKLVNNLLAEEKEKVEAIGNIEEEISKVENHTSELKSKYSQYIVWL
ncbi:MAG: hypothetical protein WC061_09660, partial [Melioribacteraceae bacterium]